MLKELKISVTEINDRIEFLANYYSPELTHILRMMIEVDAFIRPDFI